MHCRRAGVTPLPRPLHYRTDFVASHRFACSVALSSVPGIPKDKEIVLQGNLAHEAETYLVGHCGVPKGLVEVDSSKGAKLKKRK
jgi:hypothetical protein